MSSTNGNDPAWRRAQPGRSQAVQFPIPNAFEEGGGILIEFRAYELGPRGGRGLPLALPAPYWERLIPRLAQRVEEVGIDG